MSWLRKNWWVAGLLLALAVALLSPLASGHPDGLDRVAEDQGFAVRARESPLRLISGYLFPGIRDERLATIVAGVVGVVIVFGVVMGVGWLAARGRREDKDLTGFGKPAGSGFPDRKGTP